MKHEFLNHEVFITPEFQKITWNNSKNRLQPASRLDSSSHSPRLQDRRVRFHNADHWPWRHVAHGEKCQLIDPSIHTVQFIEIFRVMKQIFKGTDLSQLEKKNNRVFFLKSLDKNPSLLHFSGRKMRWIRFGQSFDSQKARSAKEPHTHTDSKKLKTNPPHVHQDSVRESQPNLHQLILLISTPLFEDTTQMSACPMWNQAFSPPLWGSQVFQALWPCLKCLSLVDGFKKRLYCRNTHRIVCIFTLTVNHIST